MFHGDLTEHEAQGLKTLRERIDAHGIPASVLDESLNLATWNIRKFGEKPRSDAAIHLIAEVLYQFDLIAITELHANLADLKRVMALLGPYWDVIYSDFGTDAGANDERMAFLYDTRMAVFTGLAGEPNPPRTKRPDGEWLAEIDWWRSPFIVSFRAGNFDFSLIACHIRYGDTVSGRVPEIETIAEWAKTRAAHPHSVDSDIMLLGDFNITSRRSSTYRAVTKHGFRIPKELAAMDLGSNLKRDKRYDQILHMPRHTAAFSDRGGVLDIYGDGFRPLFPDPAFAGFTDPDDFTYEISDHLPLWMQVETKRDEEWLDQFL